LFSAPWTTRGNGSTGRAIRRRWTRAPHRSCAAPASPRTIPQRRPGKRMSETIERPPQAYYDGIKEKFAEARDLRLHYRPEGTSQYTSDEETFAKYTLDPYADSVAHAPRAPIDDKVEVLFIGGGFSALLTAARLRERGVQSIRIVERGGDVGGTWYWNR